MVPIWIKFKKVERNNNPEDSEEDEEISENDLLQKKEMLFWK